MVMNLRLPYIVQSRNEIEKERHGTN